MILFPVGALVGGIIALALKEAGVLSAEFDGRWIAVAIGIGGLLLGHYFDDKRECARIARELDEDRIKYEKQVK
jgi:hypothetical protein